MLCVLASHFDVTHFLASFLAAQSLAPTILNHLFMSVISTMNVEKRRGWMVQTGSERHVYN